MKVSYNAEDDAAYIQFSDEEIEETEEVLDGLMNADLTKHGGLVGFEFLDASKKFPVETLYKFEILRWSEVRDTA